MSHPNRRRSRAGRAVQTVTTSTAAVAVSAGLVVSGATGTAGAAAATGAADDSGPQTDPAEAAKIKKVTETAADRVESKAVRIERHATGPTSEINAESRRTVSRSADRGGEPAVPGVESILKRVERYRGETVDGRTGDDWHRMCDRLAMRITTDRTTSGFISARSHWGLLEDRGRLRTTGHDIPIGALMFYDTSEAGHVAVYMGQGKVISTDADGAAIDVVDTDMMESWGPFVGWATPTP